MLAGGVEIVHATRLADLLSAHDRGCGANDDGIEHACVGVPVSRQGPLAVDFGQPRVKETKASSIGKVIREKLAVNESELCDKWSLK